MKITVEEFREGEGYIAEMTGENGVGETETIRCSGRSAGEAEYACQEIALAAKEKKISFREAAETSEE